MGIVHITPELLVSDYGLWDLYVGKCIVRTPKRLQRMNNTRIDNAAAWAWEQSPSIVGDIYHIMCPTKKNDPNIDALCIDRHGTKAMRCQ